MTKEEILIEEYNQKREKNNMDIAINSVLLGGSLIGTKLSLKLSGISLVLTGLLINNLSKHYRIRKKSHDVLIDFAKAKTYIKEK